jgi:hypothetical protein
MLGGDGIEVALAVFEHEQGFAQRDVGMEYRERLGAHGLGVEHVNRRPAAELERRHELERAPGRRGPSTRW